MVGKNCNELHFFSGIDNAGDDCVPTGLSAPASPAVTLQKAHPLGWLRMRAHVNGLVVYWNPRTQEVGLEDGGCYLVTPEPAVEAELKRQIQDGDINVA